MINLYCLVNNLTEVVLTTAYGSACEFNLAQVHLLSKFVNIIGYDGTCCKVSVYQSAEHVNSYTLFCFVTGENYSRVDKKYYNSLLKAGYLINDDTLFDPGIYLRWGVRAIVQDSGDLLYCEPSNNNRIVLGDFCSYISLGALRNCHGVYVIDDRITGVDYHFDMNLSLMSHFDISGLSDGSLKSLFLECGKQKRISIV